VEKENKSLLVGLAALVVLSLILSFTFGLSMANKANENNDKLADLELKVSAITPSVTATDVKSIVDEAFANIPKETAVADVPDSSKVDKLCELTDGCLEYLISESNNSNEFVVKVDSKVPKSKDFKNAFSDLVLIDKDYLDVNNVSLKDSKVVALTKEDKEDDNLKVQLFYKIKYQDEDSEDDLVGYFLVTSVLDEGYYESLSIEKVDRTFEF
jgi:hypothetical protein